MLLPHPRTHPPHQPLSLILLLVLLVIVLLAGAPHTHAGHAPRRLLLGGSDDGEGEQVEVLSKTEGGVLCYKGRAVPNLFLIGGQKCGSTTLWGYVVSREFGKGAVFKYTKEIHFADQPLLPRSTPEWLAAYSQLFPSCDDRDFSKGSVRYVMDSTPAYVRTLSAALQIGQHYSRHNLISTLKFMVSLRDPVERTLSWFGHIGRLQEKIPCEVGFNEWAKREVERARGCMEEHQSLPKARVYEECRPSALLDSWYAVQLDPWFHLFPPRTHFLIVDFHKLVRDRDATITRVLDFLNISYTLPLPNTIVHKKPTSELGLCATYPQPNMSNDTRAMLEEFFRPLNEQLKVLFERYGVMEWLPMFVTGQGERDEGGVGELEEGDWEVDVEDVDVDGGISLYQADDDYKR